MKSTDEMSPSGSVNITVRKKMSHLKIFLVLSLIAGTLAAQDSADKPSNDRPRIYIPVGPPNIIEDTRPTVDHKPIGLDRKSDNNAESGGKVDNPKRAPSRVTPPELIYAQKLGFGDIDSSIEISNKLTAKTAIAVVLTGALRDQAMSKNISDGLDLILPDLQKALKDSNGNCALVSIVIDSAQSESGKVCSLRQVNYEGVGDTAAAVLSKRVLSELRHGTIGPAPISGYKYDESESILLCAKLVDGKIMWAKSDLASVRAVVEKVVEEKIKNQTKRDQAEATARAEKKKREEEAEERKRKRQEWIEPRSCR